MNLETPVAGFYEPELKETERGNEVLSANNWDRRRRGGDSARRVLERAVEHLIVDQMREDRVFCPGAMMAVAMLREAMGAIAAEEVLNQRAGRAAASWLPKSALTRQMRDDLSEG